VVLLLLSGHDITGLPVCGLHSELTQASTRQGLPARPLERSRISEAAGDDGGFDFTALFLHYEHVVQPQPTGP
jgi:hypothetical protein